MNRLRQLVLASGNRGKLAELSELLLPLNIEVLSQTALGVTEADEPHVTFVENALAKARHAARISGLPAVADDSGLCVAALQGAPGVRSARFAGDQANDAQNNLHLLSLLADQQDRRAFFHCSIVLVRHADDPRPLIAEADWHGEVLTTAAGSGGFGYDPLFWVPALQCSAAQLTSVQKGRLSHRGQAVRRLLEQLEDERR